MSWAKTAAVLRQQRKAANLSFCSYCSEPVCTTERALNRSHQQKVEKCNRLLSGPYPCTIKLNREKKVPGSLLRNTHESLETRLSRAVFCICVGSTALLLCSIGCVCVCLHRACLVAGWSWPITLCFVASVLAVMMLMKLLSTSQYGVVSAACL